MSGIMDNVHRYFATTVALITTNGSKYGPNVMAAEWTMQISYDPMLIAVFIHESPTYYNIQDTRVIGINIASDDQAQLVNVAGGYSATEISKLSIPHVFETYPSENIKDIPMIKGCALNAECKLITAQKIGDHIMVVGEVLHAKFDKDKFPLIYTRGNYRKISRGKISPGRTIIHVTADQMYQFKQIAKDQFVLKVATALIKQPDGKLLPQKFGDSWIFPFIAINRGLDYRTILHNYLESLGICAKIGAISRIVRVLLRSGETQLRVNNIVFDCSFDRLEGCCVKWFDKLPKSKLLKILSGAY